MIGTKPLQVAFDASLTQGLPEDSLPVYEIDFDGDGLMDVPSTTPRFQHLFEDPGVYNALLKVSDGKGNTDIDILKIICDLVLENWFFLS